MSARSMSVRTVRAAPGFSLIELMVSLAIGLVVTLAITGVLVRSESSKRTSTSLNDMNQTGAYVSYIMDRALRSAGSGYSQRANESFGCTINAQRAGSALLPASGPLPAPFASVPQTFRLAPVIIGKGLASSGSDTLTVMAGNAGFGEAPIRVLTGSVSASNVGLPNTLTFRGGDLFMLIEDGIGCLIEQVATGFVGTPATLPNPAPANQFLPIGGTFAFTNGSGTDTTLTKYGVSGTAYTVALGNAANASQFLLFGVHTDNTLYSYDLLQLTPSTPVPIADGVVEMRALYGVDTTGDGKLDSWQDPTGALWGSAALLTGLPPARTRLQQIVSIRIGLVLKTSQLEKDNVASSSIKLFEDLPTALQQTHAISTADQKYRHRTVDVTIPLRNILMLY
jgi:type IV pilus assembly protein PilW